MADEDSGSKILWFFAGAAVGASIALLFAPATGEDTRKAIADTTQKGRDAIAGSSREVYDKGREMLDRGRKLADDAADMFERGRNIVEGGVAKVRDATS